MEVGELLFVYETHRSQKYFLLSVLWKFAKIRKKSCLLYHNSKCVLIYSNESRDTQVNTKISIDTYTYVVMLSPVKG